MSPESALQDAIVLALQDDAEAAALVGDRVLDWSERVPRRPCYTVRDITVVDDAADCVDGVEIFFGLDGWARLPGSDQASDLARIARRVLTGPALVLPDPYALVLLEHRSTTTAENPDNPQETRARMSFRALVETAQP